MLSEATNNNKEITLKKVFHTKTAINPNIKDTKTYKTKIDSLLKPILSNL